MGVAQAGEVIDASDIAFNHTSSIGDASAGVKRRLCMMYRDEYAMSQDMKDLLNALKWICGALLVGIGFTIPIWGAMLGLY